MKNNVLKTSGETSEKRNPWWAAMFRDPQFWVPLVILITGLILLSAIQ